MTPVELCEPLFQYVCRVNRSSRKGVAYTADQVRDESLALLEDIRSQAQSDPRLSAQFDPRRGRLFSALRYFIDDMVRGGGKPFAAGWHDLASDEGVTDGDRRFWTFLEADLADPSEAAAQRLAVYFTCVGLGFTGARRGQPELLRRRMLEMSARLRGHVEMDAGGRVCPKAYEFVNTDDLVRPPSRSLVGIAIALVAVALVVLGVNTMLFLHGKAGLTEAIRRFGGG